MVAFLLEDTVASFCFYILSLNMIARSFSDRIFLIHTDQCQMSRTALRAISVVLGIFFVFFGTLKLAPIFSEDLYRSTVSFFVNHLTRTNHKITY